jgi:hypothetical protein
VFSYLAEQVGKLGADGIDVAARVGYDDCNESLCSREVVHKVRAAPRYAVLRCAAPCCAVQRCETTRGLRG